MTAPDIDALIERLRNSLGTNWPWTWNLAGEAAAALVQLREENARLRMQPFPAIACPFCDMTAPVPAPDRAGL